MLSKFLASSLIVFSSLFSFGQQFLGLRIGPSMGFKGGQIIDLSIFPMGVEYVYKTPKNWKYTAQINYMLDNERQFPYNSKRGNCDDDTITTNVQTKVNLLNLNLLFGRKIIGNSNYSISLSTGLALEEFLSGKQTVETSYCDSTAKYLWNYPYVYEQEKISHEFTLWPERIGIVLNPSLWVKTGENVFFSFSPLFRYYLKDIEPFPNYVMNQSQLELIFGIVYQLTPPKPAPKPVETSPRREE